MSILNSNWLSPFVLLILITVFLAILITNKGKVERAFDSVMYLLLTLTFLNQSFVNLSFGSFNLFLYRIALIMATLLFLFLVFKENNLAIYWERVHVKGILLFLLFWLCYGMVSLLWVKSFSDGIKYLFLLGSGILFVYLSVFSFTKTLRLYWFYGLWMLMTVILLIIGFINHFGHYQLPTSTLYRASKGKLGYPTAVFFNQNDFATFLSISSAFYITAFKNIKKPVLKIIMLLLFGLSVYIIYLAESRASLLGVLIGLLAYGFILLPHYFKKLIALLGAGGLLAICVLFHTKAIHLIQTKLTVSSVPVMGEMSSNSVRLNLLKNTFCYFLNTYGFGVGAGNLPYYFQHDPIYYTNGVTEAHNWYAEIFGNFGLFIGLGYLTMYIYLVVSLYKIYQKKSKHKVILEAGMVGLISFFFSSISPSSVSNLYFHWVFLGFVISTVSVFNKQLKAGQRIDEGEVFDYGTYNSKSIS